MNLNNNSSNKSDKLDKILEAPSYYWPESYKKSVQKSVDKNKKYNNKKKSVYKKFSKLYYVSIWDFLPFFIGWFFSLTKTNMAYGRTRSTTCFNKKTYKVFKRKIIFVNFVHLIFGPIVFIAILFFQPLFIMSWTDLTNCWSQFFNTVFQSGEIGTNLNTAFQYFNETILVPTYNSYAWLYGLALMAAIPMLNISAIIANLVINKGSETYIKTIVTEDILKIKVSRLRKSKQIV